MTTRDLIRVSGPEAVSYLQGQLSQDVAGLAVGEVAPSFLLEPTGKVSAWLEVRRDAGDTVTLAVDGGYGDAVIQRLTRFKLRTKADIEPAGTDDDGLPEDERIAAGIPTMGAELVPGQTIPAEAGQGVIDRSVSFTKGCYTGQELVARIDSRGGNVPRHLRGVVFAGLRGPNGEARPTDAPAGAEIVVEGAPAGRLTSVAWSPAREATIALGYVPRAVEPPAAAVIRWEGGEATAEVRSLPL
jgi:folate-binding protein YgfZ